MTHNYIRRQINMTCFGAEWHPTYNKENAKQNKLITKITSTWPAIPDLINIHSAVLVMKEVERQMTTSPLHVHFKHFV